MESFKDVIERQDAQIDGPASRVQLAPECRVAEKIDENLVDFDGPDDPANPMNWKSRYKWTITVLVSMMSLVVYVESCWT